MVGHVRQLVTSRTQGYLKSASRVEQVRVEVEAVKLVVEQASTENRTQVQTLVDQAQLRFNEVTKEWIGCKIDLERKE